MDAYDIYLTANRELDQFGNAVVQGAYPAPRLTIDTIAGLRAVLERHRPGAEERFGNHCATCRQDWPCPDASDVLKVVGLPEHALYISAPLIRGEYRHLDNGMFLACCWDCGELVETATFDPIAPHGCRPKPDPADMPAAT